MSGVIALAVIAFEVTAFGDTTHEDVTLIMPLNETEVSLLLVA